MWVQPGWLDIYSLLLAFWLGYINTHSLFLPVGRLEHGWAGQLEQCCWQGCSCSCTLEQTVHVLMNEQTWTTLLEPSWSINSHVHTWYNMLSGNDEITTLNSHVTTTMNLVVVSSRVVIKYANNPCRFVKLEQCVETHDWTILLFYQVYLFYDKF